MRPADYFFAPFLAGVVLSEGVIYIGKGDYSGAFWFLAVVLAYVGWQTIYYLREYRRLNASTSRGEPK